MSADTEAPVQERKQSPGKRGLVDLGDARRGVYGVWAAFVLLLIVAAIARPALMQVSSLKTIAVLAAITAIVGLGQSAVIFVSGIDLSIPMVMTISGILFCQIANGDESRLWIALFVSILIGVVIGLINGIGSVVLGIHPVVTTIAVGAILTGITLGYTGGLVTGSPPASVGQFMLGDGSGIPAVLIALIVLTAVVTFVMRQTVFGRRLQATAYNPVSTRLAGVNSTAVATSTYVISAVCAAIGGVMIAGLSGQSYLGMGDPYLLLSVAVVALGGASFAGGRGNFLGTLGGALLLSLLTTLLTTFHLSEGMKVVIQGAVILLAVIASKIRSKRD